MKKNIFFGIILIALPASIALAQQPPQYRQEPKPISVHKITDAVYEFRGGSGANTACILTRDGVFVVDGKMHVKSAGEMVAEIKKLSDKPITDILLTHSDGDHVQGLPGFPENVRIISHANTRKHMMKANEESDSDLPLPSMTFTKRMQIHAGKTRILLFHFGPAHTDGDVVIFLPKDKVAIIGDLFFTDRDPLIHMHKNGNSFGLAKTLKQICELDAEIVLSGHSEPVGKPEIRELLKSLEDKQGAIKRMVAEGKTLDEIKTSFDIPLEEQRWKSLVEVIYLELTADK